MGAGGRSAMEYSSDPVAVRERRFVENVAEELERKYQRHSFDQLIIVYSYWQGHIAAACRNGYCTTEGCVIRSAGSGPGYRVVNRDIRRCSDA